MKGRHLIGFAELSRPEMDRILSRSAALKRERRTGKGRASLVGKSVALIFEKTSTRTRVSFEVGIHELGGYPLFLSGSELQISRGEPIRDTARVVSRYVDAVVIRAYRHEDVAEFAAWSSVPVINALTDYLHPCQLLADLFTIQEQGLDLDRVKIAYIGDGNNMANSWVEAARLYPFELRLACPEGYDPDPRILGATRGQGGRVETLRSPRAAAAGADILYTDVWVSMGQEKEKAERQLAFAGYQINRDLVAAAAPAVKVMHCLPAHRGEEITDEVLEGGCSIVFAQAENRLHVQKAVLELVAGGDGTENG